MGAVCVPGVGGEHGAGVWFGCKGCGFGTDHAERKSELSLPQSESGSASLNM